MTNKVLMRLRTERLLREMRVKHGDTHPATWAAYARFKNAWGSPVAILERQPISETAHDASCVAAMRASGFHGYANRHRRRRSP